MSRSPLATPLRRSFERARALPADAQIQECIERLTHPERLVSEVLQAYTLMRWEIEDEAYRPSPVEVAGAESRKLLVEDYIWETRELMVLGDQCSFTCLSTNVTPRPASCPPQEADACLGSGIDYVGLTCDRDAATVLGAVQAPGDGTAYPLLLRLLACLTEVTPPAQLERLNREHCKGLLGAASGEPYFDLNLVLWDREDLPEMTPISQLTRDLAEKVKLGIQDAPFPTLLRDIVCLRMNPERFDGRMRFDWRI